MRARSVSADIECAIAVHGGAGDVARDSIASTQAILDRVIIGRAISKLKSI
jgi:hypothetical protein